MSQLTNELSNMSQLNTELSNMSQLNTKLSNMSQLNTELSNMSQLNNELSNMYINLTLMMVRDEDLICEKLRKSKKPINKKISWDENLIRVNLVLPSHFAHTEDV